MFFTGLSRITDHKHHYSDVIGGALIGCIVAFFITLRVANVFKSNSALTDTSNESKSTQYELGNNTYHVDTQQMQFIPKSYQSNHVTRIPLHCIEDDYDNLACYTSS
ncbi:hypothetical protein GJ496_007648 [Pomphorhynchus laevis]|nr:hypothetical protein GJ496_007648 [Pomphorhynchus laevis]